MITVDMHTNTTTTTVSAITRMLITRPHTITTRRSVYRVYPIMTTLVNIRTRTQIHRIRICITITNKRVNFRIPTRTYMSDLTSHTMILILRLLKWDKPNKVQSFLRSGNENLILVAHHFKLRSKIPSCPQFKFRSLCRLRSIRRCPLAIPVHSIVTITTTTTVTTMMMMTRDTPHIPMATTTSIATATTKATVITCAGYSCTLWRYVSLSLWKVETQQRSGYPWLSRSDYLDTPYPVLRMDGL